MIKLNKGEPVYQSISLKVILQILIWRYFIYKNNTMSQKLPQLAIQTTVLQYERRLTVVIFINQLKPTATLDNFGTVT